MLTTSNRFVLRWIAVCSFIAGGVFAIIPIASYAIVGHGGPGMGIYGTTGAIWHFIMDVGPWFLFGILLAAVSYAIPKEPTV